MCRKIQAFAMCAALCAFLAACGGQDSLGPKGGILSKEAGESHTNGQDSGAESRASKENEDGKGSQDSQNTSADEPGSKDSEGRVEDMEPLLGADATDEDLLEVLKEETTVVSDADYAVILHSFQEDTNNHVGKIYQIEGTYVVEDGVPYLSRTVVDGEKREPCRIPLKYIMEEPEEGAWIRVTGILNRGEVGVKVVPLLEVTVLQLPDTPGQAEILTQ